MLERPPQGRFRRLLDQRRAAARARRSAPPRARWPSASARSSRAGSARSLERLQVAGPGFLNLFLADSWLREGLAAVLAAGEDYGAGGCHAARAHPGGVRLGQPNRPDARRARAQRRLRRLRWRACSHSRARGAARVLRQRRRLAGAKLWASRSARWRGARRSLRTDIAGSTSRELAAELDGASTADPAELGRAAVEVMVGRMQASLQAFAVEGFDHWQFESELHCGDPSPVAHTLALLRTARAHLPQRGRAVAAHHRLRRRQGPGARALHRRAHLLRLGHRLPPGQARARVRAPDRHLGRRPPRLPGADASRLRRARRRPRAPGDADDAARPSRAPGRARADVQALRTNLSRSRISSPRSASMRRAGFCSRARTTRRSTSTSTSPASSPARTPSTTCSTRMPASSRCSRWPVPSASPVRFRMWPVRPSAPRRISGPAMSGWGGRGSPATGRARADQAVAGAGRRGLRGGAASCAAPDRRLCPGAGPGLHRLLSRLPRRRRRARERRIAAPGAVRGVAAHDRALPGSARGDAPREM